MSRIAFLLAAAFAVQSPALSAGPWIAAADRLPEGRRIFAWEGIPDADAGAGRPDLYSIWLREGEERPSPEEASRLAVRFGEIFTDTLLGEGWMFLGDLPARPVREILVVLPRSAGGALRVFAHPPPDTSATDPPPEPPDTSATDPPPDPPFPAAEGPPPPAVPELLAVRPNPFNPETTIRFLLPGPGPVRITVHDARGRFAALLMDRFHDGTAGEVRWDGKDRSGREAPSGVYLIRMEAGAFRAVRRAVLLR